MYKKGMKQFKRGKAALALIIGASMLFSGLNIPAADTVYAGNSVKETTEDSTEEPETVEESNLLTGKTGRVDFWDWKAVSNIDQLKNVLYDNQYHPIMLATGVDYGIYHLITSYFGSYKDKHYFFNAVVDRDHVALPTRTPVRNNGFKTEFGTIKIDVDSSAYYNGYHPDDGENHSPGYFFNQYENLYLKMHCKTKIPDSDFRSNRFFTKGDSMGVPWVRQVQFKDNKAAIDIVFPKKVLTADEALVYQPNSTDWYFYNAALPENRDKSKDYEPALYMHHSPDEPAKQDYWHLVNKDMNTWFLAAFNDNNDNDICDDTWDNGVLTGGTDFVLWSMVMDMPYELIPQGSVAAYDGQPLQLRTSMKWNRFCCYKLFVGTPHLFTSIETQTIPAGKLYPMTSDAFVSAENAEKGNTQASKSEGVILPEGNVLTIDGGTVSVSCDIINNGKIVIKNGGTLIVKNGGTISPYTSLSSGGTIECNDGNIIIMEGGRIYSLTDKENIENATEPSLKLEAGSTLINYGGLAVTTAEIDAGSKIDNRAKSVFYAGVTRSDKMEMYSKGPLTTTKRYNLEFVSAGNLPTTLDECKGKFFKSYEVIKLQNTEIPYRVEITYSDESKVSIAVFQLHMMMNGADFDSEGYLEDSNTNREIVKQIILEKMIQQGMISTSKSGIKGLAGCSPQIIVEKTATFFHEDKGYDFAKTAKIIVPQY